MRSRRFGLFPALSTLWVLAACSTGGLGPSPDQTYAPGIKADAEAVDGLVVGHRLMEAGEYELALDAFTRAAGQKGLTVDVMSALGSANLGLGRLGQSEDLLRRAVKSDKVIPETWNNLGVVLMERGEYAEASEVFRRAYALDDGQTDAIRDNFRLALAKIEKTGYDTGEQEKQDYKLVRRGSSKYVIRSIP